MIKAVVLQVIVYRDATVAIQKTCQIPAVPAPGSDLLAHGDVCQVEMAVFNIDRTQAEVLLAPFAQGGIVTVEEFKSNYFEDGWIPTSIARGASRIELPDDEFEPLPDEESYRYDDTPEGTVLKKFIDDSSSTADPTDLG